MPNTRVDLTGSLNRQVNIELVSHNLNDFLPAVNFGAAKPTTSLPVTLENGAATLDAQISGDLSAPKIASHAEMSRFAVQQKVFDRFALDLAASPSGAQIRNGVFTATNWRPTSTRALALVKWQLFPVPKLRQI